MSLLDAIPESIKEVGRLKAGGIAARGAYGVALGNIGEAVASIPAQVQAQKIQEEQAAARQQEATIRQGQITAAARKAASESALNNALSNPDVLDAEGNVNLPALGQHLQGTPAMLEYPGLVEHFTQMKETAARLRSQTVKNANDEADYMGSLSAGADAFSDPGQKAGALTAGIASAVKQNIITPDRAKDLTESLIGDDGSPDPDKVKATIASLKQTSDTQRKLDDEHQRVNAQAQADIARAEAEGQKATDEKSAKRLANISSQLGAATSKTGYAMVYRGVPEDLKPLFDEPDAFDPTVSPQRARFAGMTPEQQQSAVHAIAETKATEHLRQIEQAREDRLAGGVGADDKKALAAYKSYVTDYEKAQTEARMRAPRVTTYDNEGNTVSASKAAPYLPPPAFEKWQVMTPAERQGVITTPQNRITDAEMAKRLTGGHEPPAAVPQAPPTATGGIIVTKPGTSQQFRFPDQASADKAIAAWSPATKK